MPVSVGAVTVRTALPVIPPEVALMVALPAAMALARPVLGMVATAGLLLDQVTVLLQFVCALLESLQAAAYC